MSVEIGSKSKSVQYINVHKESRSSSEFCSTDDRWTMPQLHKQSDYLVALSRFEVPMNKVAITAAMTNCIQIFRYNNETTTPAITDDLQFNRNVEHVGLTDQQIANGDKVTWEDGNAFLDACEQLPPGQGTTNDLPDVEAYNLTVNAPGSHTIDMPECFSVYEFVKKLNAQIMEALLMNEGEFMIRPKAYIGNVLQNDGSYNAGDETDGANYRHISNVANRNLFGNAAGDQPMSTEEPIAFFKIEIDSDSTFSVKMNHRFARWYYIKMSQELFDMLQFTETPTAEFDRTGLPGRRFMGDRFIRQNHAVTEFASDSNGVVGRRNDWFPTIFLSTLQARSPKYSFDRRGFINWFPMGTVKAAAADTSALSSVAHQRLEGIREYVSNFVTSFTASASAADSIVRIKSLVFSSSLATTSESSSGNTYRRVMSDFTMPVANSFSWNPHSMSTTPVSGGSISENAPAEISYQNSNPSAGRWLNLSDPSPLYELKMDVHAKCWNFQTRSFDLVPIPLPAGSTFTCKLVFISNNELYGREKPDQIHKA